MGWFDSHEGAAAWLGGVATLLATVVALGVAVWGAMSEARRRQRERSERIEAVAESLNYALELLETICQVNANVSPTHSIPLLSLNQMVSSAKLAVEHSMSIPFHDKVLLRIALNASTTINAISASLAQIVGPAVSAQAVGQLMNPLIADITKARTEVQTYRSQP